MTWPAEVPRLIEFSVEGLGRTPAEVKGQRARVAEDHQGESRGLLITKWLSDSNCSEGTVLFFSSVFEVLKKELIQVSSQKEEKPKGLVNH